MSAERNFRDDFCRGICNALTSVQKDNLVLIRQATKDGYAECECGGVADLSFPSSMTRRGRVQGRGNISPTITAEANGLCRIETQYRIRKLTPLECWRLMGFSDGDFRKAEGVNCNSQLYKQAGNSIVRDVLMAIFGEMLPEGGAAGRGRRFEMIREMEDCMDGKEAILNAGRFSYNADYGLVCEEGLDDEEGQDD